MVQGCFRTGETNPPQDSNKRNQLKTARIFSRPNVIGLIVQNLEEPGQKEAHLSTLPRGSSSAWADGWNRGPELGGSVWSWGRWPAAGRRGVPTAPLCPPWAAGGWHSRCRHLSPCCWAQRPAHGGRGESGHPLPPASTRRLCERLRAAQRTGANAPGNQIPSPAHRAPAASEDHETPAPQVRWTELSLHPTSSHTGSWAEDGECLHSSFYRYFTHNVWHIIKHYETDTRKKQ